MATRPCPNCREGMTEVAAPGVVADLCRPCGGVWLDRGELQRLAASGAEALTALDLPPTRGIGVRAERLTGLRCPQCGETLAHVTHREAPELKMAGCPRCGGLWLPPGQLTVCAHHLAQLRRPANAVAAAPPAGAASHPAGPPGTADTHQPSAPTEPLPVRSPQRPAAAAPAAEHRTASAGHGAPHPSGPARLGSAPQLNTPAGAGTRPDAPGSLVAGPARTAPAAYPSAPAEILPGRAPVVASRQPAIPVGRVFRPSLARLAGFSLLYAVGLGFISIFLTLGLTRRPDAGPYIPYLWAVGVSIPILYPLGRFWLRSGQSITVEPDALVQRTRFGTCRSPIGSIVRLRHEGASVTQPNRRGCGYDWEDFIDPSPLVVGHDIEFEVITEGDWHNNITFSQDYTDWEELVEIVTGIIEGRYRPVR